MSSEEKKDISYSNALRKQRFTMYKLSLTYPLPLYYDACSDKVPYLFIYESYEKNLLLFCLHRDETDFSISISFLDFYLKIPQKTEYLSLKFEKECIILTISKKLFKYLHLDESSLDFFFWSNEELKDQRSNYSDEKDLPVKVKLADITHRFSYLTDSIEEYFQELQSILPKDILKIIFEYSSEQVEMTYDEYYEEVKDEDSNIDYNYV